MTKWNWTGKKKLMRLSALVLLCMAAGTTLSACSKQGQKQVLAEKTQENPQSGGSLDALSGDDSQTGDSEKGNPEPGDITGGTAQRSETGKDTGADKGTGAGKQTGGDGQMGENGQMGQTLTELVEAPKRYEAQVEGKQIQLTADADVVVPAGDAIPELTVKKDPWSAEDFTVFKQLTADAAGIHWAEDQPRDDGVIDVLSQDGKYQLSFVDGAGENSTPILWMKHLYLFDGAVGSYDSGDPSALTMSEEEKEKVKAQITEKAEQFLNLLAQGNFVQKDCKWKVVLERTGESDTVTLSPQYGLLLKYAKTYRGVPTTGKVQTLMGEAAPSGQYVEFFYTSEGTLLEVKAIGREVEESIGEEERFLLPFAAVTQIFEQYCKTYSAGDNSAVSGGDIAFDGGTSVLLPVENMEETGNSASKTLICVDTVTLEYRYEQEGSQQSATGRLVPVWSFYGRQETGGENISVLVPTGNAAPKESEGLLVSIDAEDGTIYGK